MRVPEIEVRSISHFLNVLALILTDYSVISKRFTALLQYIDEVGKGTLQSNEISFGC